MCIYLNRAAKWVMRDDSGFLTFHRGKTSILGDGIRWQRMIDHHFEQVDEVGCPPA